MKLSSLGKTGVTVSSAVAVGVAALLASQLLTRRTHLIDGKSYPLPEGFALGSGGPTPMIRIPVIGDTLDFMNSGFLFLQHRVERFGNISWTNAFLANTAVLSGSEGMKIFYDRSLIARNASLAYPSHFSAIAAGHILNMMDDAPFRERRAAILSAVKEHGVLDSYLPQIEHTLDKFLRKWSAMKMKPKGSWRLVDEAHLLCAEIGTRIFLGIDDDGSTAARLLPKMSAALNGAQAPPIPVPGTWFYQGSKAAKELHAFYLDLIHQHLNGTRGSGPFPHALHHLAQQYKRHAKYDSPEGLATEVHHMMMALTALVGNALTDLFVAFEERPDAWAKLKEEVRLTLPTEPPRLSFSQKFRGLDTSTLNKLTYTTHVADEVRRLYPFVPGMFGVAKEDFVFQGKAVPKGWPVIGAFWTTLHDPLEWSDPWHFKPERFAHHAEPKAGMWWSWVPHGSGHHQCPGLDLSTYIIKLFTVHMARADCGWQLAPGQRLEQNMHLFNPEPKDGVLLHSFRCSHLVETS